MSALFIYNSTLNSLAIVGMFGCVKMLIEKIPEIIFYQVFLLFVHLIGYFQDTVCTVFTGY